MSSFNSSSTAIGKWPGCAVDQSRTWVKHWVNNTQVVRMSKSGMCNTLVPGSCSSGGSHASYSSSYGAMPVTMLATGSA